MTNKTDKEIALELTVAFLEHLSSRASSNNPNQSHATQDSVAATYRKFYSTVSNSGVSQDNE